ncbi:hemerythrin domain-containing protein [Thalassiella azotivora]
MSDDTVDGTVTVPRPDSGDVVELILADHRLFEDLMRRMRDDTQDRAALLATFSDVLVAHGEAEERHVYNALVRKDAIDDEDAEHGEHEHHELNEALLALLEVDDVDSEDFGEALEEVTKALAHHVDEEERTILNPARSEVDEGTRDRLGRAFAVERAKLLDDNVGSVESVRRIVSSGAGQD